jgi:hypothetical protein
VWVDSDPSRIVHLTDTLKEISTQGMNAFFEKELTLELQRELTKLDLTYPYRAITHPRGIGFMSVYDPRYKRVIFTKKDYKPLRRVRRIGEIPNVGDLYYDETTADFYYYTTNLPNVTPIKTEVTNPKFFEDKSFTVSYAFQHDA